MTENQKKKAAFGCANVNTQYFASIAANLIMIGCGCAMGWVSMALPLLRSDASPLETGKLTISEMSWVGSVAALGAFAGNCICGFTVTIIGTRHTIFLIGFPQLVSWLFMTFGTRPMHLVVSRFLSGIVIGGAQTCVFLYVAEIADNKIRGQLGTIFMNARNFGILIAFSLGTYFDYITSSLFFTAITIIFLVAIWFVPSTPQYFLQRNQIESAQKAFNFYNQHRLQSDPKYCTVQFQNLTVVAKVVETDSKLAWKDIIKSRRGFWQAIVFSLLNRLTAQSIFVTYGSIIIAKSGTHLSAGGSSIFMALVQLLATIVTYKLIDRKGRKFLLIVSLIGCAISHAVMVSYMHLRKHGGYGFQTSELFQWTPILCMASVIFMSSIGMIPLTNICMAESFPTKIRPLGMTFGNIVLNTDAFILFKMYPLVEQLIGLQACLMVFCISCTLGTIYVAAFVEETKGKELNE